MPGGAQWTPSPVTGKHVQPCSARWPGCGPPADTELTDAAAIATAARTDKASRRMGHSSWFRDSSTASPSLALLPIVAARRSAPAGMAVDGRGDSRIALRAMAGRRTRGNRPTPAAGQRRGRLRPGANHYRARLAPADLPKEAIAARAGLLRALLEAADPDTRSRATRPVRRAPRDAVRLAITSIRGQYRSGDRRSRTDRARTTAARPALRICPAGSVRS